MKKVAVSQRIDVIRERNECRDALDQRMCAWLIASGCLPLPVPNVLVGAVAEGRIQGGLAAWLDALAPDAVVLSGGNDVGGFAQRDETERALLSYARELRKPVLGVCRGMQMMAVWAGGQLKPVAGHVRTRHRLSGQIAGEANSYHDFGLAGCPTGFRVLAASEDGEIEAMRHAELPWEGWMWHPERETEFLSRDLVRLKELFRG